MPWGFAKRAAPLTAFLLVLVIGHEAIVEHQTTILAIICLIAAFAAGTLAYFIWPVKNF